MTVDCIEDEIIPDDTVPETTVVGSSGGLPSTGRSSGLVTGLAALALLGGSVLARLTRRS